VELVRAPPSEVDGRFELPKPCGARPESVVLPCALQERVFAEGGRLAESCDCRLALSPPDALVIECATVVVAPRPA
jgi:hypothetical protein